jgi:hypothetical protein
MFFTKKSFLRKQQESRGEIPETYHYNLDQKFKIQFTHIWKRINFRYADTIYDKLCFEFNIPFDAKKATLNKLLDTAQAHVNTVAHDFQYFKQIILDVGRVRNPSGHGHAQGQAPQLDEVYVRFVINQAAANLLFLAEVPMRP